MKPSKETIEKHRNIWTKVAKENGWYRKPIHIQCWVDKKTGDILDSIYLLGDHVTEDIIEYAGADDCEMTDCGNHKGDEE